MGLSPLAQLLGEYSSDIGKFRQYYNSRRHNAEQTKQLLSQSRGHTLYRRFPAPNSKYCYYSMQLGFSIGNYQYKYSCGMRPPNTAQNQSKYLALVTQDLKEFPMGHPYHELSLFGDTIFLKK